MNCTFIYIQELVNGLNEGTVRRLAVELLRRQPAMFADLVNGELPAMNVDPPVPPENTGPPEGSNSLGNPIGASADCVQPRQHKLKTNVVPKVFESA